ncbi:MAG: efflux RND transporter permease subunit, partial [Bacteroidota bacterium]
MLNRFISFFLENKLVTGIVLVGFITWGVVTAPFNWDLGGLPSNPVAVDAIPDIGENQQIVYTEWPGKSPQDIEDQVTYPLTTALLGVPGVKTIRSNSIFGLSSIYIIFEEDVAFYWSRSRILEKLNALPSGTLPEGVKPALGPDATALGQVYWYTLEGRDENNQPAVGWDPHELRTIQDFYVRYGLMGAEGVAEVASIGGFVKEYQVDIDPQAMKAHRVSVNQIMNAVRESNQDIGARTLEYNKVEYLVRAIGYVKNLDDVRQSVVAVRDRVPIRIQDVARVNYGPASRRGGLDKGGAEAVGGVVVARYGANPLQVINNVKDKIKEIRPGLPSKELEDGSESKVTIVPFYDRTGLIKETLGTLESALSEEIIISIIVIIILMMSLKASFLVSGLLPLGVLMTFIAMRYFGIPANIVALSGIAIAIGVMVDVGVVFTENIIRHIKLPENKGARGKALLPVVQHATMEVAPAVMTAIITTIVSFLPVFALEAAEGKLFRPLAFTKTFAMVAAMVIGLVIVPALAHMIFSIRFDRKRVRWIMGFLLVGFGLLFLFGGNVYVGIVLILLGVNNGLDPVRWTSVNLIGLNHINIGLVLLLVLFYLAREWMPLGPENSMVLNLFFVLFVVGLVLGVLMTILYFYKSILIWALNNKRTFLLIPVVIVLLGLFIWQGTGTILGFLPQSVKDSKAFSSFEDVFPGMGEEFMPDLDEGAFLLMPTTMPHSGVEENIEVIRLVDKKINAIPEVDQVVGKWGRVNSALDPAPISMFENVINYHSEYVLDEDGRRVRFRVDKQKQYVLNYSLNPSDFTKDFTRLSELNAQELEDNNMALLFDNQDKDLMIRYGDSLFEASSYLKKDKYDSIRSEITSLLIPDERGDYFRNWRDHIQNPDDIWELILDASKVPGLTSAPKLQPIQTRLVMLQTGMRAPMGIKVFGPDLETIDKTAVEIEEHLKKVEGVKPASVFADRMVGKPYLEIRIKRRAISRYGLTIKDMQDIISGTIGGRVLTETVEGRERFPVRVRFARAFRDNPDELKNVLISTGSGNQVPLGELADIEYRRGPQSIKSENTFLLGYVIFDKKEGFAEVDVVENAQAKLDQLQQDKELVLPAGVNYVFAGDYENQVRATQRLMIIIPVSLLVIFLILYFQFRSVTVSGMIFTGIVVAFSGGFLMLWLYGQQWFLDFPVAGINIRDLFQMGTINLSVAVWVGFIALFGIATDDGVLM